MMPGAAYEGNVRGHMPYDQKSFFYMGLTDGDGRRLSFFPNDFEYYSEDEKLDDQEDYKSENGEMIAHL